jgi:hypothetical protein
MKYNYISRNIFCQYVPSLLFKGSVEKNARETFEEEQRLDFREKGTSSEARQSNQK